jgi:rod shape-determining protein MreD
MRTLPVIGAVIVALLLQAGVAPYLAIGPVTPNFMLLVALTVALTSGPTAGTSTGFAAGLLFDLLGSGAVGPMALVLAITGYVAGLMHEQMFAEGWLLPLTVLFFAALATELAHGLLLVLLGVDMSFWRAFATMMAPSAVYNTVLALLIYPWLARFLRNDSPMKTFRRLA